MKNNLNFEIGKRVREQREYMGKTREEFSEKLEISERFLTDIELGNRGMSFTTLIRLCKILSISSDYILMGITDENKKPDTKISRIAASIDEKYLPYAEELLKTFAEAVEKGNCN